MIISVALLWFQDYWVLLARTTLSEYLCMQQPHRRANDNQLSHKGMQAFKRLPENLAQVRIRCWANQAKPHRYRLRKRSKQMPLQMVAIAY